MYPCVVEDGWSSFLLSLAPCLAEFVVVMLALLPGVPVLLEQDASLGNSGGRAAQGDADGGREVRHRQGHGVWPHTKHLTDTCGQLSLSTCSAEKLRSSSGALNGGSQAGYNGRCRDERLQVVAG